MENEVTRRKLKKILEPLGCKLSEVKDTGDPRMKEITVMPPEGMIFVEGYTDHFCYWYYPYDGEKVSDIYDDIAERIKYGIEPKES